ncbi:hypothetical protein D9756_003662 [Leucocoprinus leucothites]|uniref:Nephrocystin 3-like N-terminal domain-containing protein n=1 Tax=Leucocoprinus leucothites TaxID=201217 RepID=A0A8H5LJC9_9AGAR|nr:hypothetical protein D9756_003662 [Leucoagaricus leucothites]
MPGRSRRFFAKFFRHHDQAPDSIQPEAPALRSPPTRLAQPPVHSPPTHLPLEPHFAPLLQPDTLRHENFVLAAPAPPTAFTSVPPGPEPQNLTPTTLSPASTSPAPSFPALPPHSQGNGVFHQAHHLVFYNPQFNESSLSGYGLAQLLKYSMPSAFHDSSARYPPPKCHLRTRKEYIDLATNWAQGESGCKEPILWMRGPFGIGKTAIAQSCAEALEPIDKLAATVFFSRSSPDRDDPRRIFTSIAYQVATKCAQFRDIMNKRMVQDPALAAKSLPTQFENLLVHPLGMVDVPASSLDGRVVIIDGLDECRGIAEQCEVIRIIAASARKRTTPFRWFITSRPEDHINRTMNSTTVSPLCSRIELPVSRAIDHEILIYLTDELAQVRTDHGLPESWPSEDALALLVDRGAGLWIYVATMVRFIKDENSYGPEDQLRIVLEFAKGISTNVEVDNPLAEMDFFYTLIMQRIPPKLRRTVRDILLIRSIANRSLDDISNVLCLSEEQFRRACASIQSVMELQGSDIKSMCIKFHHTSFLDFMKDPRRSKELCIYGDFLVAWRQELLKWLHQVCSLSTGTVFSEPLLGFLF